MITENDMPRVLDNMYDGLYMVDVNKKITYWNKAAERITSFIGDEIMGPLWRSSAKGCACLSRIP